MEVQQVIVVFDVQYQAEDDGISGLAVKGFMDICNLAWI